MRWICNFLTSPRGNLSRKTENITSSTSSCKILYRYAANLYLPLQITTCVEISSCLVGKYNATNSHGRTPKKRDMDFLMRHTSLTDSVGT